MHPRTGRPAAVAFVAAPEPLWHRSPAACWEGRIAKEYPKAQPRGGAGQGEAEQRFKDLVGGGEPG